MPRPRRVSDDEILGAAFIVMVERGPALTLAEIGDKVGLSAATVVQRFGSKRALLLGVARLWAKRAGSPLEDNGGPIEKLLGSSSELLGWLQAPRHVANVTAALHTDLADPEFREIIMGGIAAQRRIISAMLDKAVTAGDIRHSDTEQLARLMQVACHGALQIWAIEPEGELKGWVISCLEATLSPWRLSEVTAV